MNYILRPIAWCVAPEKEPQFSEMATIVTLEDEAAGEFVKVEQPSQSGAIRIDPQEWPAIRDAIENAFKYATNHD
jgi:hypothetical protein